MDGHDASIGAVQNPCNVSAEWFLVPVGGNYRFQPQHSNQYLDIDNTARSVTQAVEGLERDGLVRRTQHPDDGRAKLVALTPAGAAELVAGTAAGAQALHQIFGGLDHRRLATLDNLLAAVETSLADAGQPTAL
jgi:DNA-binding MarR family transcriptional regulator